MKEFDSDSNTVKGITLQEEYTHVREGRAPVWCCFQLDEIKDLVCQDINFDLNMTSAESCLAN